MFTANESEEIEEETLEIEVEGRKSVQSQYRLQSKHRVTFSSDIEEYEDNASDGTEAKDDNDDDDDAVDKELIEIIDRNDDETVKLDEFLRTMSIEEIFSNGSTDDNEYQTEIEVVEEILNDEQSIAKKKIPDSIEIKKKSFSTNTSTDSKCSTSKKSENKSIQRKRTKSATVHNATTKPDDILRIHLNVKSCCEFKYLENNRLPRYNGFFSQYGLSKDQLDRRELARRKNFENHLRRQRDILRAKQQIANLNELAFRQWLIRKNHQAKPKYKNFYDLHLNTK